jgi:hypothetical protein
MRISRSKRGQQKMVGLRSLRERGIGDKSGQQEMVGFVLIVAIVMVGLMVFLVISLRDTGNEVVSVEAGHLLNSLMKSTSECVPVFEPQYDDVEDLFKSCHRGVRCKNLAKDSCEYLEEELERIVKELLKTENTVGAYELEFFEKEAPSQKLLKISEGKCPENGVVSSAQKSIVSGSRSLIVGMRFCKLS